MIKKIQLVLSILLVGLSACGQTAAKNDRSDKAAMEMLMSFFKSYTTEVEKSGIDNARLNDLKKEYLTEGLVKKNNKAALDYDPLLNAQDVNQEMIKTLKITRGNLKNSYTVCFNDSYDSIDNCLKVLVVLTAGHYKIGKIESLEDHLLPPPGSKSGVVEKADLNSYINNKSFFTKEIDVNKDGISDKIASNRAYEKNNDLFVFFGTADGSYKLVLSTTNFSSDGGDVIENIYPLKVEKGFMVKTYFPDRGYYEKEHYIILKNNTWVLRNIIYKTMSDVSENALKYICDVPQNIEITGSGYK